MSLKIKHKNAIKELIRNEYTTVFHKDTLTNVIQEFINKLGLHKVEQEELHLYFQEFIKPDTKKNHIFLKAKKKKVIQNIEPELDQKPVQESKFINYKHEPVGSQWVHDIQVDDVLTKEEQQRSKIYDKLKNIKYPEQRSEGWFKMRSTKITASDGGTVLNMNHHEPPFKFILKKTVGAPYSGNKFTYHGTKYEEVATMIYEYRKNVKVTEFGLCGHPTIDFLGASPDGIVSKYKLDGIHLTKHVGTMLEIKCPAVRAIQTEGEIKDGICPLYYWAQVQLQLQCCELTQCDFWQCSIYEYKNRTEFLTDTQEKESFRSKKTGFEKGCIIQLLPKKCIGVDDKEYWQTVYDNSKFLYPPKIEMSPEECDKWVADQLEMIRRTPTWFNYTLDKVLYWRLDKSHNVMIERDDKWFNESLPTLDKMWKYVLFIRENKEYQDLLSEYVTKLDMKTGPQEWKANDRIMDFVDKIYNKTSVEELKKIIEDEVIVVRKARKSGFNYGEENFDNFVFDE